MPPVVARRGPPPKKDPNEKKNKAAIKLQCSVRKFTARVRVRRVAMQSWQRVFDPSFKLYFWYNKLNGQSQWTVPRFTTLYSKEDAEAAIKMESVVRGFLGRMKARRVVFAKYTRYFDANVSKFYWTVNETGKAFWKASAWLIKQQVPMPLEDQMLYASHLKIQELESKLKEKDAEIKKIRKSRYEELEPAVLADRVKNAKALVRPKNMDEWTIDELAAWFTELKMDEYIPFIYTNRVDGNLFINLSDEDWVDMGIKNRFHTRKLQIILKAFRTRYERKKDKILEDDDLMSEYAPSELSDMIAAEDFSDAGGEEEADEGETSFVVEVEEVKLTAEQLQEKALDDANIQINIVYPGDGLNFPMTGDIVRCSYTCTLLSTNKMITSTKNAMQKASVEFVLGVGQIIKGFDRALPRMTVGERSRVSMTSEYAYGPTGLFPHIPPNSELMFEITLLGFRPRPVWVKPLLQEPGLSEKPYQTTKGQNMGVGMEVAK